MSEFAKRGKGRHGEFAELPESPASVASVNECTGLMPTPPENGYEEKSYKGLFTTEIPLYAPGDINIKDGVYDSEPPVVRN